MDTQEVLGHIAKSNQLPPGFSWMEVHDMLKGAVSETLSVASQNLHSSCDEQNFSAENAYLMEQFSMQEGPTFTLQRLAEILIDPAQYNCVGNDGNSLRGDKLQAALRRCILVSPLDC